jgi:hypothetical protein
MSTNRPEARPEESGLVVASHNLMHGVRLEKLIPHYLAFRQAEGLHLLCLQEDRYVGAGLAGVGERPSDRILAALGEGHRPDRYQVVRRDDCPGLAFIYDRATLHCASQEVVPLPRLQSLSWFEKLYILGGRTKQKYVLLALLKPLGGGQAFTATCFHLDTAGGNAHRLSQVRSIAEALQARGLERRLVACGDTNAFAWRRQAAALDRLLAPLAAFGAVDPASRPTHFFARQDEPKVAHQIGVLLGKLGLDLPRRYDVVCANLPVARRGQVPTPGSDHDLVWAALEA